MPNFYQRVRGAASATEHFFKDRITTSEGDDPDIPERIERKIQILGEKPGEGDKNTNRLTTVKREMDGIDRSNAGREKRSKMIRLLAQQLERTANNPDNHLKESHIETICRLLLKHACTLFYKTTSDTAYGKSLSARMSKNHRIPKTLLAFGSDTDNITKEARIDLVTCIAGCLANAEGGTELKMSPEILAYLSDLLKENVHRLNRHGLSAAEADAIKAPLRDAARRIISRNPDDWERVRTAALLFHCALSVVDDTGPFEKRLTRERTHLLRQFPFIPKPVRHHLSTDDHRPATTFFPPGVSLHLKDMCETILPVYKDALKHLGPRSDSLYIFRQVILEHTRSMMEAAIEERERNVPAGGSSPEDMAAMRTRLGGIFKTFQGTLEHTAVGEQAFEQEVGNVVRNFRQALAAQPGAPAVGAGPSHAQRADDVDAITPVPPLG